VLDLLLFGRLKAIKRQLLRQLSSGRDLDHIMLIFWVSGRRTGLGSNGEMGQLIRSSMKEKSGNLLNSRSIGAQAAATMGWLEERFFKVKY
jgi:hypothetical protein